MIDSIIFDLDGTLWDTSSTCAIAWNNVIERHKIPFRKILIEDIERVTGKPHEDCVKEIFQELDKQFIQTLIDETKTEDVKMVDNLGGAIYEGVEKGLKRLNKTYPLFIVSNCQSGYIESFLDFSGFADLFEDFECWGNTNHSKSHNVKLVIERNTLQRPLMVGDTMGDAVAAFDNDIAFAFLEYGFGDAEKSVTHRFDSFTSLSNEILQGSSWT